MKMKTMSGYVLASVLVSLIGVKGYADDSNLDDLGKELCSNLEVLHDGNKAALYSELAKLTVKKEQQDKSERLKGLKVNAENFRFDSVALSTDTLAAIKAHQKGINWAEKNYSSAEGTAPSREKMEFLYKLEASIFTQERRAQIIAEIDQAMGGLQFVAKDNTDPHRGREKYWGADSTAVYVLRPRGEQLIRVEIMKPGLNQPMAKVDFDLFHGTVTFSTTVDAEIAEVRKAIESLNACKADLVNEVIIKSKQSTRSEGPTAEGTNSDSQKQKGSTQGASVAR